MTRLLLPVWIGIRYNRSSDKQRFLSLLSWVSLIGMMLGVSALIVVLSVMNGFQAELRDRMLDLIAHGQIETQQGEPLQNWQEMQLQILAQPKIIAAAPLVGGDVMISSQGRLRAAVLQGVDVEQENTISNINKRMIAGSLESLNEHRYGIVMGSILARSLGLTPGDKVAVILPQITVTPMGAQPRIKQFTIIAIFQVGADLDATHAYISLPDAQRLYKTDNQVHAIRYLTDEVLTAATTAVELQNTLDAKEDNIDVVPWTEQKAQLFSAVKMEKTLVMFMLSMVIAVAAFNLISVLSMMVSDKRNEIAVLRMMGLNRQGILGVFLTQGMSLAMVSVIIGGVAGVLAALNLSELITLIESVFGFYIFDPNVFYISGLPSDLQQKDVIYVVILSLVLSVVFTIYPAYRASKIEPVEALQYQ